MADKLYKKLPGILQTDATKNFFESTVEQLFSKANVEVINGYVGLQKSEDFDVTSEFLRESTATRQHYALSPAVNTLNANTNASENLIFYDEFLDTLKISGTGTNNQNRLFSTDYSSFLPPIDIDKFVNYQEYYWSYDQLPAIRISGTVDNPIDIDVDIIGKKSFTSANGVTLKSGMRIIFDGGYVIPDTKTTAEYFVEGVGESIRLIDTNENVETPFSTATLTAWDSTAFTSNDSNVAYTAGNISSVSVLHGGIGYINPVVNFIGANTSVASATANVDSNGTITDVTVTNTGANYSAPISIQISSDSITTSLNSGNTFVTFLNESISQIAPYKTISVDSTNDVFAGQQFSLNGETRTIETVNNASIIAIENITNQYDSSRTPGSYIVNGTGGSGSGQEFIVDVVGPNADGIVEVGNITLSNTSLTGTYPIDFRSANSFIAGNITTSGTGANAYLSVTLDGSGGADIEIVKGGDGFVENDTITISDNILGGDGSGNLELVVTDAVTVGDTFISLSKNGSGFIVGETITISDSDLGGGGANNITFDIARIGDTLTIDEEIYLDGTSNGNIQFIANGFQASIQTSMFTLTSDANGSVITGVSSMALAGVNPTTGEFYLSGSPDFGENFGWDIDTDSSLPGGDAEGDIPWGGRTTQDNPDYNVVGRGASNKNIWSRVNFWHHADNFKEAGVDLPGAEYRAKRPIIEFDYSLEMFNTGNLSVGVVNIVSNEFNKDDIDGTISSDTVDNSPLSIGSTIIFPNDEDNKKYIFKIAHVGGNISLSKIGDPISNPADTEEGDVGFIPFEFKEGMQVSIKSGALGRGLEYHFKDNNLILAQSKLKLHQAPLFNLYNDEGKYLGDELLFKDNTFIGSKIFNYKVGTGTDDSVLNFPLSYKPFTNSAEIEFQNFLETDRTNYIPVGSTSETEILGYYYFKSQNGYSNNWKMSDSKSMQDIKTFYHINTFNIKDKNTKYYIGCEPNINSNKSSGYDITVLKNGSEIKDYTYVGKGFIEFNTFNFIAKDIIEIIAKSDSGLLNERSISKYTIPLNWSRNPDKENITFISEPEYLGHFTNLIKGQENFTGKELEANNFKDTAKNSKFATDIVNVEEDLRLGAFLLDDQPHNLLEAIRFSEREYTKYKNRLRSEVTKYYNSFDVNEFTNEYILNQVLRNVLSLNVGNNTFQQTYIVPFGDNYIEESFIINDVSLRSFTMTAYEDLKKLENSLLVYKARGNTHTLLTINEEFTLDSYNPIKITLNANLDIELGDIIYLKLYNKDRDSAQCPPTPSAMGLYPLTLPVIEKDYSFKEEISVLVGHDGSRSTLFGDARDDIILEFEKRIYNSAIEELIDANSLPSLNIFNVRAGAFRKTNFSNSEWFDLLSNNFSNWVKDNNVDPVINETYNSSDSWTWNFRGSQDIPGYWKGWYEYYYDTVRPHTHPWEMLGFTEKPSWWEDEYGTDYTSTNTALWDDLELGIIRKGPRANFVDNSYLDLPNNPCARIGLHEVIPVDGNGNLISPYDIISTGSTTLKTVWTNAFVSNTFPGNTFINNDGSLNNGVSVSTDASNIYISSNALVNHDINLTTNNVGHNELEEQIISYNVPFTSISGINSVTSNPTSMPEYAIGVLVNGLPLYNVASENSFDNGNTWHYNKLLSEHSDLELGHTDEKGLLHYYKPSPQILGLDEWSTDEHSPIVGWSFDGIPIYGPYGYTEYEANGDIKDNTITNIKSCFRLRLGDRISTPKGSYSGYFVEDYEYDSSKEGIPGHTGSTSSGSYGKYNLRYGITPDSNGTPIQFYVATQDDNGEPMFPYAIGGGTKTHSGGNLVYANKYYGTPQDIANNTLSKGYENTSASEIVRTIKTIDKSSTDKINDSWMLGDGAPVENAWKYSSSYPFAITTALLLAKPGRFATVFADPINVVSTNIEKKRLIHKNTRRSWNFKDSTDFIIHGSRDTNGNFVSNVGYTQFIKSYLNYQGLEIQDNFITPLKTLNIKLAHRMSGFIDKDTSTIRTDQYSITGSARTLIIPSENISINVHDSAYKSRNSYTGVIIEKTTNGYKVRGYDRSFSYFTILESDKNGRKQSIERGGKPADYVNWSTNQSFNINTIVKYLNSYYIAKEKIPASSSFDKSLWSRLPSLPQIGGAKGVYYNDTTGFTRRVNYDTEYTKVEDLFDFLVSLGRYQKSLGYSFGEYDTTINDVRDWAYAAEQFLFWTTGGWEIGNTLELSPMASNVIFENSNEFVAKINKTDKNQFTLLDQDGISISPEECSILRENNRIEITPPQGRQIYSAVLFTKQIEHALILDNLTDFNDTIYNPLLNQRQDRIFIKGKRTLGWTGRFSSEGYIIDNDELQPNLDNATSTMGDYHTLGFIPVDKDVYVASRSLFGFEERSYLTDLDILDDDQFEFYKGMLQSKGTEQSLSQIGRSSSIVQGNITVYSEWALKTGEFGDTDNEQSLELKIDKHEIVQDPQLFKLEFPEDVTGIIKDIVITENKHKYFTVPSLEISAPTKEPKEQATGLVTLDSDGLISSATITNQGSGYESQNAVAKVLAGNINISDTSTTFNVVIAQSSALFGNANVVGISDIEITDHFGNGLATNIDLSSANTVIDVVSAINSNSITNANVVASSVESFDANSNTNFYVLQITGNDFTLGGSGLANLNISADRYQPKQRYAIDIAGNTSAGTGATVKSDILVYVDNTLVSDTNYDYDAGDRWQFTTSSIITSGNYVQNILNPGSENSSSAFASENIVQVDEKYPFVDVYVNGTKLINDTNQTQYTVANTTAITFPDVTNLPGGKLDTNANVYIVERATIDFVDAYQGDIPGKTLQIKVQTNDGIAFTYGEKKLYTITPDIENDEIITIDIDDNERFLKKPTGARNNKLWPTTDKVNYSGVTDSDYRTLPNAGYVLRNNVDYQAYGVTDIADLFDVDRLYKPSKDNLIHVASSENKDWNVYKLRQPANSQISFVEQESIDDTAYLYSTSNLFDYIDSNQLQQNDLSRYLDYTLVLKKASITDNLVIWTNQEIVDKKSAMIRDFGAVSMLQTDVANVTPIDTYEITNIQPAFSQVIEGTATVGANSTVTISYNQGAPKNGDTVRIVDIADNNQTYSASNIAHKDYGNANLSPAPGAVYNSYIEVTTNAANVANIVPNVTPIVLTFTASDYDGIEVEDVLEEVFVASNVNYATGVFEIYSDSAVFQSYFGNVVHDSNIANITSNITNISYSIDVKSNIHNQQYTISNVNPNTSTFTITDANVTANVSPVMVEYFNKCELTVLPIIANTTSYMHDLVAGDVIKVFSQNIRGYYNVQDATEETIIINAPYDSNIATTGKIVTRGVDIQTTENHNLDKKYKGKRVMIHNADNRYYNQLYRVFNVINDNTIRNTEIFAYEPGRTELANAILTTLDHDVVKLNNTSIKIDNISSVPAIADSINRTQAIKRGFTTSDTFGLSFPMLTNGINNLGFKPLDFAGSIPYVTKFDREALENLTIAGGLPIAKNLPTGFTKDKIKGNELEPKYIEAMSNRDGVPNPMTFIEPIGQGSNLPYNQPVQSPINKTIDPYVAPIDYGEPKDTITEVPVVRITSKGASRLKGVDKNPRLGNRESVVLTASVLDTAPKKKCGPECSTTRYRGTRKEDIKNPVTCYTGVNLTNWSVNGTGKDERKWQSQYSGFYTPTNSAGGSHGSIGFQKLGIAGAKTWSDNGSTESITMSFTSQTKGTIYIHVYQIGKGSYDTTRISVSGGSPDFSTLPGYYIGKTERAGSVSRNIIRLDLEEGDNITISGTCRGGGNHWHALEFHLSAQEASFNTCSLPQTDNSEEDSGTANAPSTGTDTDRKIFAYHYKGTSIGFPWWSQEEKRNHFYSVSNGGLGTLLFEHWGIADAINIFQGKDKESCSKLIGQSNLDQLRKLTSEEKDLLMHGELWGTSGTKNFAKTPFTGGFKPESKITNKRYGVRGSGALDFNINEEDGKFLRIEVYGKSTYHHALQLPNVIPDIENPGVDPNPVVGCGEETPIPEDANSSVVATPSAGAKTSIITPVGNPTTKKQSGGNRRRGGGGGHTRYDQTAYKYHHNFAGFNRPSMAGFSFIPSIFRKSVKLTYAPDYGVPVSLASGRYVNNNVQKISGGFILPLAKRLTSNIPLDSAPLRSLDSKELPFYNILDANQRSFERGGIFYNFDPRKISSSIKLSDGTFVDVSTGTTITAGEDGQLLGLNLGETFNYDNPYDGSNPFGPPSEDPVDVIPPEEISEGPVQPDEYNENMIITITPTDGDNNPAGPEVPVPIFRPTPGYTIDLNGINLNPEDDFFINGTRIAPKGNSQADILKSINCVAVTGFEAKPIGKDKIRISSCTNAPLTVKEGCSGGVYKEVLDFHIVKSFVNSEVSNTSVLAPGTISGNTNPVNNYTHLDTDGGVIGTSTSTTSGATGQGYVLSSKSVTTGGDGYSVGDRLRLIGGTPITDPFAGIKEICIPFAGAGYSAPENIVITIGDGTTPGRNATVKGVVFDKNNGIKNVLIDNPGSEYDANRPPVVNIIDTGSAQSPIVWASNISVSTNDLIQYNVKGVEFITNISSADADRTPGTYDVDTYNYSLQGGRKAEFRITIDETGAATVDILAPGIDFPQIAGGTFTIDAGDIGGTGSDLTFDLFSVGTVDIKYYQAYGNFTTGNTFDTNNLRERNSWTAPVPAKLEAVVAENGRIPRVAKFEVTSTDYLGGITSLRIIDRGIYKVFPSDLTNGLPIEYDHVNLGDETGTDDDGNFTQGSGLGEFDPQTLIALESPGAYDPILGLTGGGRGAKVFLTSREIPDCSQKGGMKDALGLPDLINDLNPLDDLASAIQGAIGDYGYDPDDLNVDVDDINDYIGRLKINAPGFEGINIDELTPGLLTKLGIPPGDYNVASLCIQAVVETSEADDNPVVIDKLTEFADNLGLGISKEGPVEVLKLLCVDTIGTGPGSQTPGLTDDNNVNIPGASSNINGDGSNGQDRNSIFGDGKVTFAKDLYQYELRTVTGKPVNLLGSEISQETEVLYLESQRYDTETALVSANNINISNNINTFGNVWIDDYQGNGWAYLENGDIILQQEDMVDPKFINNSLLYDSETGNKKYDLDLWDPFKGVLPGFIDKEIDFISENDPVVYTSSRSKFDDNYVGKVWWDTSTLRYNWYEQGTNRQRWLNWGSTFPGSVISLYEWVKSDVPPTGFAGEGTPKSTDGYIERKERNPVTNILQPVYYYWVRNLKVLSDEVANRLGRNYDTYTLATYISDPINYGLNLISFISDNSFVASNLSQIIDDEGDHLQINFSRSLNNDGKKHASWALTREGDNNSIIPEDHSRKLIDSICEKDSAGNIVPDPLLSKVQKYGINFRPRQTMFKNAKESRRELVKYLNNLFAGLKLNTEYSNWDSTLPVERKYIKTVDWFETKGRDNVSKQPIYFDETFKPIYKVNSTAELFTLNNIDDGTVVQVQGSASERAKLYIYDGISKTFGLISIKAETIQIDSSAYTDDINDQLANELRLLLQLLKDNVLKEKVIWNNLFFTMLNYAMVEQPQLDWAFKTSYVYVEKEEEDLKEFKGFKPDNFEKVIEYMNEVKPFTAKIREYKDGKSTPIEYIKDQMISDFDKPPYVDFVNGTVRILDENNADDVTILSTDTQYTKYNSISNKGSSPIRQGNTTIVFDRTNWKPTQFEWQPSVESANLSIAKNLAWLSSSSNTIVSANTNVRAVDRLFKYDSGIQSSFSTGMQNYLTTELSYSSDDASNIANINLQNNIFNAIETGYLDSTLSDLKLKVGGNFKGEILDANVFTKVVPGSDGTSDLQTTFAYDTLTYDSDSLDINADVVNYSGTFDDSEVDFRRFDATYQGFDGVTFNKMLYGEERPEELISIDPLENFIITVTTSGYENGDATGNLITANASTVIYRTHKDMFGGAEFIRVNLSNATTLSANVDVKDDVISVVDASILPKPRENTPGVIWIESERIEYKSRDTVNNIITELTRGTRGTTPQSWIITDESGASITRNVYDGSEDQTFTNLVQEPEKGIWLDSGAISLSDKANSDIGNISSIMNFLHNN